MKVFLVDDNPTALRMLMHAFSRAGYQVVTATSGIEALSKIPDEQPDVVVMDVMMPGMDGMEATRQLRADPATAHVPIILLTARDRIEDKLTGFGSGADDYVVKPVMPAELIARCTALVRRSQRFTEPTQAQRGQTLGFLGVKGGVGTTSLAVNVALALAQDEKNVILVDLHPWAGTCALQMGLEPRASIALLMEREPSEITRRLLQDSLERHRSGVQVFAVPYRGAERIVDLSPEHLIAIIDHLEMMGEVIVVDLGSGIHSTTIELMKRCHSTTLVLGLDAISLALASEAVKQLRETGLVGSRLRLAAVNRFLSAWTYTREEIEERLGSQLVTLITPAPETCFQAIESSTPVLLSQPNTVVATQLRELSNKLV